jgi:hypothetical protein
MRRVSVEVKERQLKSMNAKVAEYSNGNRLCTSYEIPVAAYVDFDKDRPEGEKSGFGAIVLGADWARSNATIGHVSEFLQELGGGKLRAADIRAQIANGGITVVPTSDMRRIVSSN